MANVTRLGALILRIEETTLRECSRCHERWPADWDYCIHCNVWLPGHECRVTTTSIVPADGVEAVPELTAVATLVAVDLRKGPNFHDVASYAQARSLFEGAIAAMGLHSGRVVQIRERGIAGYWTSTGSTESAARAIDSFMAKTRSADSSPRPRHASWQNVTLGVGAIVGNPGEAAEEMLNRAFRLAALAHPNRVLFSRTVYERVVDRFDLRGVQPVVPRAEHQEPVFELIGPKPERSGTHHVGPEKAPMVGRVGFLRKLEQYRQEAMQGKSTVVHLIAEPGLGKSKLIREWLGQCERDGSLSGWVKLYCNGVPYGDYPRRSWQRLVAPLFAGDTTGAEENPTVRGVHEKLTAHGQRILLVVDDVHWIDSESQDLIVELVSGLNAALAIFAYRPSFSSASLKQIDHAQRRFQIAPLSEAETLQLIDSLAAEAHVELTASARHAIALHSRGSPLYLHEAVAHVGDAGRKVLSSLPRSLLELLILRVEWAAETLVPDLERQQREYLIWGNRTAGSGLVARVDKVEEQLSAWLDRFDVIEEASVQTVRRFLDALHRVDSQLALLSILLGRQRPHRNRLAQALTRVASFVEQAGNGVSGERR